MNQEEKLLTKPLLAYLWQKVKSLVSASRSIPVEILDITETSGYHLTMNPGCHYSVGRDIAGPLGITLAPPTDKTIVNEYTLDFRVCEVTPNVTLPSDIVWTETPQFECGHYYEMSVRAVWDAYWKKWRYYGLLQDWPYDGT